MKIIPCHVMEHLSVPVFSEILSFSKVKILNMQHILIVEGRMRVKADSKCDPV